MLRHCALFCVVFFCGLSELPAQERSTPITRIAVGSCADQNKPCPIWAKLVEQKPQLTLLIGDNIYADIEQGRLEPANPLKIARCYDTLNAVADFQRLRKESILLGTWDDHDYGNNDAGVEWKYKKEAQKLFLDFFQVPADSARRQRQGIYHAEIYGPPGQRVQVIMLDTRYHRSALQFGSPHAIAPYGMIRKPYIPVTDANATMLGADQWSWLEEQLKLPAELRIIGSSIQLVSNDHPFEKWGNIPAERDRLFKLIRDTQANGVIVVSGDRHLGELSVEPNMAGYPLLDLTSSGLNQGSKSWRLPEANRNRLASMPYGNNSGLILVDWSNEPRVTLQLRNETGEVEMQHTVPLGVLKVSHSSDTAKSTPGLPAGVIRPVEATKMIGETVTVQFVVRGGRAISNRILLNSLPDFRNPENFTVVLMKAGMTGKYADANFELFKEKLIRATGKVVTFKDTAQIQIEDAAKLEILD